MDEPATALRASNERRRPVLLSPDELGALLGIPVQTLYRWRYLQKGPPGFRVGRHVRYSLKDVQEWLESRRGIPRTAGGRLSEL
jgi:excisionase family DNA binding protein